ncbi:AAC(3) family N-acetyltransferase [Deinococcus lacus]|uniref:Aminoglycoside N(3)-acetyltransferase n=1 Tax=Deinococcus lacus TaxID=392561 RepID=A0ABW1YD57_9DEIO
MLSLLRKSAVTARQLDAGLQELGLDGTQQVIVHASLSSFGRLEGGARAAVDTLLGRTDTLVAPAFTYSTLLSRPTSRVQARFHRDMRVSVDIGKIPQELVDRADSVRSFHPGLSFIASGPQAARITASQTLASPYQPVGTLYDLDGWCLMIGTDFASNTSIHYGEYLAGVPLLTRYVPLGDQVVPIAFPNCSADFGNLEPVTGRSVTVGESLLRLYRVRDLVDATVQRLQQDPEALLCRYASCRCQQVRQLIRAEGLHPRMHRVT